MFGKKLKTSTKISLKFTLYTSFIVLLFGLGANTFFLNTWYKNVYRMFDQPRFFKERKMMGGRMSQAKMVYTIPLNDDLVETIEENRLGHNNFGVDISKIGDDYIMYKIIGDTFNFIVVTEHVESQLHLLRITIYMMIVLGMFSYFLSLIFVKRSLMSLNKLVEHAKSLHMNNLDRMIEVEGPSDDEIKILADALNTSLAKIHQQTSALKDFINNASHEIKTPLMEINTEIDYSIKAKDYKQGLVNIKEQVKVINELLEVLLQITKFENTGSLKKQNQIVNEHIEIIINRIEKIYKDKKIHLDLDMQDGIKLKCNILALEIVVKNLLENAYKYTPKGGHISMKLTKKELMIEDTGIGIDVKHIDKIWDRFWKADNSRTDINSFGLGLYLVKKLVDLQGWDISVNSTLGEGTIFVVKF